MLGACAYLAAGVCTRTHHDTISDGDLTLIVLVLVVTLESSTDPGSSNEVRIIGHEGTDSELL